MFVSKKLALAISLTTSLFSAHAFAATGTIQLSGNVAEVFQLQVRGVPGDLDLSPKSVITDRLLGLLHLKYNKPMTDFSLSADTASGLPEDANGTAIDQAVPMTFTVQNCASADGTAVINATDWGGSTPFTVIAADAALAGASTGIEEDCELRASWTGTDAALPLAGVYKMTITATITD